MSFLDKRSRAVVLLLVLCTLSVYANTFRNPFLWDDNLLILQNELIHDARHLPDLFTTEFFSKSVRESDFSDGGYYRPLVSLSFMADYALWKENPFGYHLTNFIFHLLNVFLVYLLGKVLWGKRTTPAFFGALLFAIHPIQTEAVSFIPSRVDLIATFFYLGAWVLFDQAVRRQSVKRLSGSLVLFVFSLLSKEMSVTLPILLSLYGLVFDGQDRKRAFSFTIPFWVLLLNYLLLRNFVFPLTEKPFWGYFPRLPWALVSSGTLLFSYVWLLIFPHPLHVERTHRVVETVWSLQGLVFLVLVAVLCAGFWSLRRRKEERFLLSIFLCSVLPVLNIVPIYPSMAEHYLYLPSIPFFLLVAEGFDRKRGIFPEGPVKKGCALLGCLVLIGYGTRTILRNQDYADEISFFEETRRYTPQSSLIHGNLGALYLARGRPAEAIPELQRALQIDPNLPKTLANLGMAYRDLGDYEKAIVQFLKAIEMEPQATFYNSLGVCYGMHGKAEEAEDAFQKAISLDPDFAGAYYNLGKLYWDQQKWSEVDAVWRKGLEKDPKHPFLREWLERLQKTKEVQQK